MCAFLISVFFSPKAKLPEGNFEYKNITIKGIQTAKAARPHKYLLDLSHYISWSREHVGECIIYRITKQNKGQNTPPTVILLSIYDAYAKKGNIGDFLLASILSRDAKVQNIENRNKIHQTIGKCKSNAFRLWYTFFL